MTTPSQNVPASQTAAAPAPSSGSLVGSLTRTLVLLAIGGAGTWYWLHWTGQFRDDRDVMPAELLVETPPKPGTLVTVEPIVLRPVQRTIEALGTLRGYEEIVVSAKSEGRIQKLHFDVATRVAPGQPLVEIDPVDLQLAVSRAEADLQVELSKLGLTQVPDDQFDLASVPTVMLAKAQLDNAEINRKRLQRLSAENATTASQVDTAISELKMAQAELAQQLLMAKSSLATVRQRNAALDIARQQLADARTVAPHLSRPETPDLKDASYVVISRSVTEGSFVRVGDEICRLSIDRTLKLRTPVPERYSNTIHIGQTASILTPATSKPVSGTVTLIYPSVDPKTRTFDIEITIENSTGLLKSGGFAKALIATETTPDAITVPVHALVRFAGVTKLFLNQQGIAREFQVQTGVQTRDWVEITSPTLPTGAQVITSGQTLLSDGAAVAIRDAASPKSPESKATALEAQTAGTGSENGAGL